MSQPTTADAWPVLWRGAANAWECDELGHLNVRFYAAKALEAFAVLVEELGVPNGERVDPISAARPTRVHIRFLREVRPGRRLTIAGGVAHWDEAGLEAALELRDAVDATPCAGVCIAAEHADPITGRAFPWPTRFAERASAFAVTPPPHIAPKGLAPGPDGPPVTVAAANAAGLAVIGQGVFHGEEVAVDGRLRPHAFIGRASDASGFLFQPALAAAPDLDIVVLEMRLDILRRPASGDRFLIRGGVIEVAEKTVQSRQWFFEPASGAPWAALSVMGVFFDVKARAAARPPKSVVAAVRARTALAAAG